MRGARGVGVLVGRGVGLGMGAGTVGLLVGRGGGVTVGSFILVDGGMRNA